MSEESSAPNPPAGRRRSSPEESGGGGKALNIILILLVLGLGFALFKAKSGGGADIRVATCALNLELLHRGLELGFVPYKAPDWAVRELAARADAGYRELFERLRNALDPARIMNPARLPFRPPGEST